MLPLSVEAIIKIAKAISREKRATLRYKKAKSFHYIRRITCVVLAQPINIHERNHSSFPSEVMNSLVQ